MNWLLLRGLGRVKEHWLDFPEQLKKSINPEDKVLCLDLPGFGNESAVQVPLSIAAHTEYVRQNFFSTRPEEGKSNWGLVGLSLGGMVALDWAARFRADFNRLVVINTSARDVSTITQRLTPFAIYSAGRMLTAKSPRTREKQSLKLITNLKMNDEKLLSDMVRIAEQYPMLRDKIWRQVAAAALFNSPSQINIPTLIVSSLKDRMVDARCSKAIAEKLASNAKSAALVQIKFHPTAGHDLPLDDAEWLIERLLEFEKA